MLLRRLSITSIHFARQTDIAATELYGRGFAGVHASAQLDILLERHGRLVESMPSQMERSEMERKLSDLARIEERLFDLLESPEISEDLHTGSLKRVSQYLPDLFSTANDVSFFARELAQDKAVENALIYEGILIKIKELTQKFRSEKLSEARASIARVNAALYSLSFWVFLFAGAAIFLVGPMGIATMQRVLFRLKRITGAMAQLASHDTTVSIPYDGDGDEVGAMARAVSVFKENALQLALRERELKELHGRLNDALNNMTHGLCMVDSSHALILCNNMYAQMYSLPATLTRPGTAHSAIEAYCGSTSAGVSLTKRVASTQQAQYDAFIDQLTDGREISVSRRPMNGGGWVAVHEDVTLRRKAEAEIYHLARHDAVTGLPNRFAMREHLTQALALANAGASCAVFCIDLDWFKAANDTFGHSTGDRLLRNVGGRILEATRATDCVARIGGDEFAVIQEGLEDPGAAARLAQRLIDVISVPYQIDDREITIGASIGVAFAPRDGCEPDQILKNADLALYAAKSRGRGHFCIYEPAMGEDLCSQIELEQELRAAIARDGLDLVYQPIVCANTGRTKSVEALIRWRANRGVIAPSDLIPLAERTGLINQLGAWVIQKSTAEAATWPADVAVAVNVSAYQFSGWTLLDDVKTALVLSGLPASRLHLEITETALLRDEEHAFDVLQSLRSLGVQISLDDFGTGFSSLSYLRSFRFDKIKIDRTFVQEMTSRSDCNSIVQAVTGLARKLGIRTTAEGVETWHQLQAVRGAQCHEAQGYLFARPMPGADLPEYFAAQSPLPPPFTPLDFVADTTTYVTTASRPRRVKAR